MCPPSIRSTSETIAPIAGWEIVPAPGQRPLENAQIFDGHPRELAALVPEETTRGQRLLARWRFAGSERREFWLACSYRDTSVQLTMKLDARYQECQIEYQRRIGAPPGRLTSITCH